MPFKINEPVKINYDRQKIRCNKNIGLYVELYQIVVSNLTVAY